jgi:hypothetical protein
MRESDMKGDNLDAMGKTNRLLFPIFAALVVLLMGWSLVSTVKYVLGGGSLPRLGWAQFAADACAIGCILVSVIDAVRKTTKPSWLYSILWLGWGAGTAYQQGGMAGLWLVAAAVPVLVLLGWLMRRNAPNFGRAGIEDKT